jgi:hypothetical protein
MSIFSFFQEFKQLLDIRTTTAAPGALQVREAVLSHPDWRRFVSQRLEPRNRRESVLSWQCGRPMLHGPISVEPDGELFHTELDFDASSGLEGGLGAKDVYQRYGAYGDEDDDDEEAGGAGVAWRATSDQHERGGAAMAAHSIEDGDMMMMSSPPGPGGNLSDLDDDAVILENEAAEQLLELGGLSLEDNSGDENAPPADPTDLDPSQFNANVFWRPTFAMPIDDD